MKTNYEIGAIKLAEKYGIKLSVIGQPRYKQTYSFTSQNATFKMQLRRNKKQYTFDFHQSIANGEKIPTFYDVFACLTKYDVGDFDEFCGDFGYEKYDEDSNKLHKNSMKIYNAVCREYKNVVRLFGDIIEELQEIS